MEHGQNGATVGEPIGTVGAAGAASPHLVPPATGTRWWLWPLVLAMVAAVFVLQRPEAGDPSLREKIEKGLEVPPPGIETSGVFGKLALAMRDLSPMNAEIFVTMLDEEAVHSKSPTERFRAAVLAAEIFGDAEASMIDASVEQSAGLFGSPGPRVTVSGALDQIESKLDAASPLHADIDALRAALAGNPPAPGSDAAKGLVERHGETLGTIAATLHDPTAPPHDPATPAGAVRQRAAARGWGILTLFATFGFVFVSAAIAGTVLLIVVAATGRPRLLDPRRWDRGPAVGALAAPGGETVWLETFAVFVAGFLVLKGVTTGVVALAHAYGAPNSPAPLVAALVLQWALVLTLLWPLARGVRWSDYRRRMGYHAGRGVLREIATGVTAYVAAVPLLIGAALVAVVLMIAWRAIAGDAGAPLPENRLMDMVGGSWWQVVLLGMLAVIWAPLVEEGIFRGALFRHLRRAMPAFAAAVVVGLFFAVMHGYMVFQLIVIATLGTVFAMMREWRGSIIPSMTAHALHNSMVLILLTTLVALAGD